MAQKIKNLDNEFTQSQNKKRKLSIKRAKWYEKD